MSLLKQLNALGYYTDEQLLEQQLSKITFNKNVVKNIVKKHSKNVLYNKLYKPHGIYYIKHANHEENITIIDENNFVINTYKLYSKKDIRNLIITQRKLIKTDEKILYQTQLELYELVEFLEGKTLEVLIPIIQNYKYCQKCSNIIKYLDKNNICNKCYSLEIY